jgi:hypothetical protein
LAWRRRQSISISVCGRVRILGTSKYDESVFILDLPKEEGVCGLGADGDEELFGCGVGGAGGGGYGDVDVGLF